MARLALVRHGESEWNAKNLWTGWEDKLLSPRGYLQAKAAAEKLRGVGWNLIFESDLTRVKDSAEVSIKTLGLKVPTIETASLRERDYGIYTGRNKLKVKKEIGDAEFEKLHRAWDYPIESGESLKQVYERVVPYYLREIEPRLKTGQNIIIFASGNSLRALIKYIDKISDKDISKIELETGEVKTYSV